MIYVHIWKKSLEEIDASIDKMDREFKEFSNEIWTG
ncbi:hypothetical protein BOM_1249 (plasmid) [Borrelia miyamotoi FR64b]|uniref:Uncharacterized protein n=1 Tax=Borrelia miyamotoi FR64b TaxID=1292392 RepID=W5SFT7_9SPIR|nr:hypothetical protein BOM_1249 [Borrelia miyamotoi FR64b]